MNLEEQIAEVEALISKLWDGSERRDTNMLYLNRSLVAIAKGQQEQIQELKKEIDQLKKPRIVTQPQTQKGESER